MRAALRPTREEALAAGASAALFAVAFPPFPSVVPALVCLVPLAVAVARAADARAPIHVAARTAFWFGALGYACNLYWMATALPAWSPLAALGYVVAVAVLGGLVALAGAVLYAARCATRLPLGLALPVAWVTLEVALNYLGDLAFPWLPLGLATARTPLLAQIADVSGVRGVSFWIAATNGLLADAWMAWKGYGIRDSGVLTQGVSSDYRTRIPESRWSSTLAPAAAAIVLAALVAVYGAWRVRTIPLRALARIAVIQPNVAPAETWAGAYGARSVGVLAAMTRAAARHGGVDLVVWPETALPGEVRAHPEWRDTLAALGPDVRAPILLGAIDRQAEPGAGSAVYNSALLTDALGALAAQPAHHKSFLVPVIERMPFADAVPLATVALGAGFARGVRARPSVLPFGRAGVLVCFEVIFPQLARSYRSQGADVLVNISNDAWLGRTVAPYQHEAHLVLRAIENRVAVVRSANSGISTYVDPLGRAHSATPLFTPAVRTYDVAATAARTPYTRYGDWVGLLSALVAGALAAKFGRIARRGRLA